MPICSTPGCPEWVKKAGPCTTHKRERWRKTNAKRPSARAQGYGAKWEKEAKAYLAFFPGCNRCPAKATDVHHADGLGPKGPRGYDWTNFEGLCHPCHSRETGREHGFGSR